ncbi:hypothetical protein F4778DRAFT_740029 [Xylariomycetidae sp. FL2044]|nr:hypothetical protein F4778DRAFT_740029 [Xylariomycetidae sp. FL2044]
MPHLVVAIAMPVLIQTARWLPESPLSLDLGMAELGPKTELGRATELGPEPWLEPEPELELESLPASQTWRRHTKKFLVLSSSDRTLVILNVSN